MSDETTNDEMSDETGAVAEPDPAWEAMVRDALRDPVPDDVVARSLALLEFASIDAELATLVAEESADLELAGVRSTITVTTFTFVAGAFTIELEYDGAALAGQLFPSEAAELDLMNAMGDRRRVAANSVGTFQVGQVIRGSWCLVVHAAAGGAVRTAWFTL
jgi:hypothetical protein